MFSAVLIHAEPNRARMLRALALDTNQLMILRELASPPDDYELTRTLNTLGPEVVVLDIYAGKPALDCAARVQALSPGTALIGYGCAAGMASLAHQVGFSAVLADSAETGDLLVAIHDAMHQRQGGVETNLFSFLPSKAGSGASTVVLNTSARIAGMGQRTLVIDADLRSGILAFLLNIHPEHSLQSLLMRSSEIDTFRWQNTVVSMHGVDFLLSSRSLDCSMPEWKDYFMLLNFARSRYEAILVDLPELVNPATVEFVRRSKMVFPVCTTETPSLKLTSQRGAELARWGVPGERIGVVVNRWHRTDPSPTELAGVLGMPVITTLPNNYEEVRDAVSKGTPVLSTSRLGQAFTEFAARLMDRPVPEPPRPSKLRALFSGTPR